MPVKLSPELSISIRIPSVDSRVNSLATAPNGDLVACTEDGRVLRWDISSLVPVPAIIDCLDKDNYDILRSPTIGKEFFARVSALSLWKARRAGETKEQIDTRIESLKKHGFLQPVSKEWLDIYTMIEAQGSQSQASVSTSLDSAKKAIKDAIKKNPHVKQETDPFGWELAHYAAMFGCPPWVIDAFHQAGYTSTNEPDPIGNTRHHIAAAYGCDRHLMPAGLDSTNPLNAQGETALHVACRAGQLSVVRVLYGRFPDTVLQKSHMGLTPRDLAIRAGHLRAGHQHVADFLCSKEPYFPIIYKAWFAVDPLKEKLPIAYKISLDAMKGHQQCAEKMPNLSDNLKMYLTLAVKQLQAVAQAIVSEKDNVAALKQAAKETVNSVEALINDSTNKVLPDIKKACRLTRYTLEQDESVCASVLRARV